MCALIYKFLCTQNYVQYQTVRGNELFDSSMERPGSIVTKTLKNGFLIPIVTSKESKFNADFQYISFISITYQKLRT